MKQRITITLLLCICALITFVSSCTKKRPFLCGCYNIGEHRSYDIDVKSKAEAEIGCEHIEAKDGWDSCYIIMHE